MDHELGRAVRAARNVLEKLLTPDEFRTRRTPGSDAPKTFEDAARSIVQSDDPRAQAVGEALEAFQTAVNAFWVYALEQDLAERFLSRWIKKREPERHLIPVIFDEGLSEVHIALRYAIVRFDPERGAKLNTYATLPMLQAVDRWFATRFSVVHIPDKVAREGVTPYQEYDVTFEETAEARRRGYYHPEEWNNNTNDDYYSD